MDCMRSIKFRVWDEKYSDWETGCQYFYPCSDLIKQGRVFTQYTGLHDENGSELYEGDIVTYSFKMAEHGDHERHIGQLLWSDEYGAWGLGKIEVWNLMSDFSIKIHKLRGNVFENRELLDEKQDI